MIKQAIITKYLGPTNHRGSRVKATCAAGSITIPWNYEYESEVNHMYAAEALMVKCEWRGYELIQGCLFNNVGYAFVLVEAYKGAK